MSTEVLPMTSGHLSFNFQHSPLSSGNEVSYFQFSFMIYVCQLRSRLSEVTQINQIKQVSVITASRAQRRQRHSQFVHTHVSFRTFCLLERLEKMFWKIQADGHDVKCSGLFKRLKQTTVILSSIQCLFRQYCHVTGQLYINRLPQCSKLDESDDTATLYRSERTVTHCTQQLYRSERTVTHCTQQLYRSVSVQNYKHEY
jgi:hypothetical protein